MPTQAKYTEVMSVIERRIREGDYLLNSIPGERKIAEETGVSYMTARRAVLALLDQKVLIRGPSGALDVHPGYTKKAKLAEVVLLYPAYSSTYLTQLRSLVSDFAERRDIGLRPAQFVHWDENTVVEAVEQARGTLVIPYGPEIPDRARRCVSREQGRDSRRRFHRTRNCRLFDCFPTVASSACWSISIVWDIARSTASTLKIETPKPIAASRFGNNGSSIAGWTASFGTIRRPLFTDPTVVAYRLMGRLVEKRKTEATAFVATTCPAAIGAIRACWERDVNVGKDVSICAINIEPPAEFFCPSITGLNTPDLSDVFERSVDWFFDDKNWRGAHLMEPTESSLFEGESTGKPARSR